MSSAYHEFADDGEGRCGHFVRGEPCGRLRGSHRRDARRGDRHAEGRKGDRHSAESQPRKREQKFIFFDTEGFGKEVDHRLVYGAAVDEEGTVVLEVDARAGGTPQAWLDALLEVGKRTGQRSCFAYGFGYDRTKMLEGLPGRTLYLLTRREERPKIPAPTSGRGSKSKPRPEPLYWGDYILDLQGTCFSVAKLQREEDGRPKRSKKGKRVYSRMTVWDVLKFFQCPFVDALDAWRRKDAVGGKKGENLESELVVPDDELEAMRVTKGQRAHLEDLPWDDVRAYCQSECRYGARLVRELTSAAEKIGVDLRRYDGAGSISDALMRGQEVQRFMSAKSKDPWMRDSVDRRRIDDAVMRAFAGGRFETAYCGIQRGKVWAKDIASAYPYAMYGLPCLACGRWERVGSGKGEVRGVDKKIEAATLALCRVEVRPRDKNQAFGSLANRNADGDITFPLENLTWCWKPEYLAARDGMRDKVRVSEAFLYTTECDHRPFRFMPDLYLERLRIGKEGRGIAMKLGYNGCAGKTMQHVGSHRWQEYIWAGNTTSTTRAQLLWAISRFKDPWEVCYLATDSVFALRDVEFPEPDDTGTQEARTVYGKYPLGAWEPAKQPYDGMCLVRPGVAFPLNATDEQLKEIKARGVSKSVLLKNIPKIVEAMSSQEYVGQKDACLEFKRRVFRGMKVSVHKKGRPVQYVVANDYGQWDDEQKIKIKIGAKPKRYERMPGEDGMLLPHPYKPESLPYNFKKRSAEAKALQELQDMVLEQPDMDLGDIATEELE